MNHAPKNMPGRFVIIVLAGALLTGQIVLEYPYYHDHLWRLVLVFGEQDFFPYSLFPWWAPALATGINVIAVAFSLRRQASLGWKWWYVAMPCIILFASLLVALAVPIVREHVVVG
jgi:hypothetical protein